MFPGERYAFFENNLIPRRILPRVCIGTWKKQNFRISFHATPRNVRIDPSHTFHRVFLVKCLKGFFRARFVMHERSPFIRVFISQGQRIIGVKYFSIQVQRHEDYIDSISGERLLHLFPYYFLRRSFSRFCLDERLINFISPNIFYLIFIQHLELRYQPGTNESSFSEIASKVSSLRCNVILKFKKSSSVARKRENTKLCVG